MLDRPRAKGLGTSAKGHGPRSKTIGPRSTEQHPGSSSRDPKSPHQCPWPINHAHGCLGQFQRSRFRAESHSAKLPAASESGRSPMVQSPATVGGAGTGRPLPPTTMPVGFDSATDTRLQIKSGRNSVDLQQLSLQEY